MFDQRTDQVGQGFSNYDHGAPIAKINSFGRTNTLRFVSTRKPDMNALSIMPKTAVNYYNLRKGLYLKNQGRGMSASR